MPAHPALQDDSDERRRLAAVRAHRILDTPPEAAFDDIARIAAHICNAPKAAVSLVAEERQWFKARIRIEHSETDLSRSFCKYAVRDRATLVVEDASTHPVFATYPNVVGEDQLRFYAGAPMIDSEGHALGTVCVMSSEPATLDARQVATLEALAREAAARIELRKAAATLGESARAKRELLDLLAHEINGAISPVVMGVEMLEDAEVGPEERAELLRIVQRNLSRAGHLARDVSELARLEGERFRVTPTRLDVSATIASVVGAMRLVARDAGVAIEVDAPPGAFALADARRIEQVVTNLVSNALKFTPRAGRVTVRARSTAGLVHVEVEDTGQGMTPEQAARLFERFSQLGHLARDADPGNGLGLYICRQVAHAHGGDIACRSEGPGKGSTFVFTLPAG